MLYDKIWRADILAHAYALAKANGGAPGVDGVTFDQIEAAGVEGWLAGLRRGPADENVPARAGAAGDDPQAGGGERPLGIPTMKDRVAQAAAKLVIEPIFEADFNRTAYGYRPRRSRRGDAVRKSASKLLKARATQTWWMPICRNTSTRSRTPS